MQLYVHVARAIPKALAENRSQSVPPGALATVLTHRFPESALEIALGHLARTDYRDRNGQDTLSAWTVARVAKQSPSMVGAHAVEIRDLVERIDAQDILNARTLAIYLVHALTWAEGPAVAEALERFATPSPERVAVLERQGVRVDRSDLVRFPTEYIDPLADVSPEGPDGRTTRELHDWAKASLRRREKDGDARMDEPRNSPQ
jgi:hypothetical protein